MSFQLSLLFGSQDWRLRQANPLGGRTSTIILFSVLDLRSVDILLKPSGNSSEINRWADMPVTLHGYRYSAYVRIVRMVLAEKDVAYERTEINPFADDVPDEYLDMHPFGQVPTLVHDNFILYETTAITRYIDMAFDGPTLQPAAPRQYARMAQIIAIIDSYGYWPMVRQVFSQRVFGPRLGRPVDKREIETGLDTSGQVLRALDDLVGSDGFLVASRLSLADLHLAPMMAYFTAAPEGRAALDRYPKLSRWWKAMATRDSLAETDPGLPPE